jgi:hypothetical protein
MRARKLFVGAVLGSAIVLGGIPAYGYGLDPGDRQATAIAKCEAVVLMQEENDVWPGGGPKTQSGFPGPTNCDHWFQLDLGLIGNQ